MVYRVESFVVIPTASLSNPVGPRGEWTVALLWLLCLAAVFPVFGMDHPAIDAIEVDLNTIQETRSVGQQLRWLEDPEGALSLGEIVRADGEGAIPWTRSTVETPNLGYTDSAYWWRLDLINRGITTQDRLLEVGYPVLDDVDIFWVRDGVALRHLRTGDRQPFDQRLIPHRHFLFPLVLEPGESGVLYLRTRSSSSMQLPLRIGPETDFFVQDQPALIGQALYLGMMLVMILFNLFLFFSLRESAYLYYVCFVTSFTTVQMCLHGLPAQYLTGALPWMQDLLLGVGIPAIVLFAALFTRSFLDLAQSSPRMDRFFQVAAVYAGLCMMLALLLPYRSAIRFSIGGVLPVSLACLAIGPYLWRRGYLIARYYTLAWVSITLAAFLLALNKFGWLPRTFLTENGLQIGAVAEAVLLSLALADRLNREREARFRAQSQALNESRQRLEAEERLMHAALHNGLTGLPNRTYLEHWFDSPEGKRVQEAGGCLVLLHLRRFHEVNRTLGHLQADNLLQQLSARINREALALPGVVLLETDPGRGGEQEYCHAVASVEGVSFALMMRGAHVETHREGLNRLIASLSEPVEYLGLLIEVGGMAGLARFPEQEQDIRGLIRCAQIALDMGQRHGQLLTEFDESINPYSARRLALAGELRQALRRGGLELHFQPKVSAGGQRVTGVEALLRWRHPELGFIAPTEFIPIAEQTGVIHELTHWVLDHAVQRIAELTGQGLAISVAVNISAINLKERQFAERVSDVLQRHGLSPSQLVLEVTESAMMDDPERALQVLRQLSEIGIRLSIDDFGTGYSSLAYIKQLPVQEIKIDRSFVMDMESTHNDQVIVRTTVNMCHDLGLDVVAEGVETASACEALRDLGCDYLQGYYLSRPLPYDQFLHWLKVSGQLQS